MKTNRKPTQAELEAFATEHSVTVAQLDRALTAFKASSPSVNWPDALEIVLASIREGKQNDTYFHTRHKSR